MTAWTCALLTLQLLATAPSAAPPAPRGDDWPIPATLPDGRRVELFADGRWRWRPDGFGPASDRLVDHAKPAGATQMVSLVPGRLVLWLDPHAWSEDLDGRHPDPRTPEGRTPDAWTFEYAGGDAIARVAARRTAMPLDVLADLAVEHLEQGLDDVRVTGESHRRANGLDQLVIEARAEWRGEPVHVLDFCVSTAGGSAQLAVWCAVRDVEDLRPAMEALADGLARVTRPR